MQRALGARGGEGGGSDLSGRRGRVMSGRPALVARAAAAAAAVAAARAAAAAGCTCIAGAAAARVGTHRYTRRCLHRSPRSRRRAKAPPIGASCARAGGLGQRGLGWKGSRGADQVICRLATASNRAEWAAECDSCWRGLAHGRAAVVDERDETGTRPQFANWDGFTAFITTRAPYWIKGLNFASAQTTHLGGRSGYARCSVNAGWPYPETIR